MQCDLMTVLVFILLYECPHGGAIHTNNMHMSQFSPNVEPYVKHFKQTHIYEMVSHV